MIVQLESIRYDLEQALIDDFAEYQMGKLPAATKRLRDKEHTDSLRYVKRKINVYQKELKQTRSNLSKASKVKREQELARVKAKIGKLRKRPKRADAVLKEVEGEIIPSKMPGDVGVWLDLTKALSTLSSSELYTIFVALTISGKQRTSPGKANLVKKIINIAKVNRINLNSFRFIVETMGLHDILARTPRGLVN